MRSASMWLYPLQDLMDYSRRISSVDWLDEWNIVGEVNWDKKKMYRIMVTEIVEVKEEAVDGIQLVRTSEASL